jgi:polar amino acid transport system substrate-binding protein
MRTLLTFFILLLLFPKVLFAGELEKVSLELQWLDQFQFAGFYVAQEEGYYKEVGLDVDIRPLAKSTDIVADIRSQKTTYATARSSVLIEQSKKANLVVLDAIFEHSPSVLLTTNLALKHPYDLKNKKIMVTKDEALASSFYAMLASQGVANQEITTQQHSFNLDDLINGKTDAMACYISNEPFILKERNINFNVLNPKDYGYDFYGDLLITSQKELQENPDRAKKFVTASRKGWKKAFENVEATAKLIFEKYNQQNKSFQSLVYEGEVLKALSCDNPDIGPILNYKRFDQMSDFYLFNHLITIKPNLVQFLDPLNFNRKTYTIGILAERGASNAINKWQPLIDNMNYELSNYNIIIRPLSFVGIENAVKSESIDFVLTSSMQYVQLEAKYGTSRMATLINNDSTMLLNDYGAVIFTRADNEEVNKLSDVKNRSFAAVHQLSLGGWVIAKKLFQDSGITEEEFASVEFLQTHDNVVNAVLSNKVEVGTVRTGVLEELSKNGIINLTDIKILHRLHYTNFPFLVSTPLYPEWSFAKMKHTDNTISNAILSDLLHPSHLKDSSLASWSIPLDYKPIHDLLIALKLDPYKPVPLSYTLFFEKYYFVFIVIFIIIITLLLFNRYLKNIVKKRTTQLLEANERLKLLAHTDELTNIANRRQFMKLAERYFSVAKRNETPLCILSLDIDWFKKINDTHGHDIGDQVLKLFSRTIESILRESDVFGRLGGEEFSILLQNTTSQHALYLAEKIRKAIEETPYIDAKNTFVNFTVSIGVTTMNEDCDTLATLLKNADNALYKAKENGRNRVEFI